MADTDTTTPQAGADTPPAAGDPAADPATTDTNGNGSPGGSQDTPPEPAEDKQVSALRSEAANWRTKLRATEAELKKLQEASSTDQDAAVAAAREEARREVFAEALSEGNDRLRRGEVLAAAANKLTDPADAVRLLDLDKFPVSDDGTVDRRAIATAIDELVKAKPYLAGGRDPEFGARRPAENGAAKDMNAWLRKAAGR